MTDVRVTQEPVLVLHGGAESDVRVTQTPTLVLHGGITSKARVTQEAILVLHGPPSYIQTSEAYGNFPIYTSDGAGITYISGTYNYTILVGSNLNTATYFESGTTSFTDGVCEISVGASGMAQDDQAILVIQKDESIGVYPAIVASYWGG